MRTKHQQASWINYILFFFFLANFAALHVEAVEQKSVHEVELQSGAQFIEKKQYGEGYKTFKKLADGGCPYSQCVVGLMHKNGIGVKKDPQLAIAYFEKSAKQGFGDAQRWLGEMYYKGEGVRADHAKALEWFEKAARNDIVEAQYKIGHLYRTSGLASAKAKGAAWIAKAEKTGVADLEEQAKRLPQIPMNRYSGSSSTYSNGVSNITQSWSGYSSLAKSLTATQ
jgi:TPR repeat protein